MYFFCSGVLDNENCFNAQKITLDQKKTILSEKKACFSCMKTGHRASSCKQKLKWIIYNNPHVIMVYQFIKKDVKQKDVRGEQLGEQ